MLFLRGPSPARQHLEIRKISPTGIFVWPRDPYPIARDQRSYSPLAVDLAQDRPVITNAFPAILVLDAEPIMQPLAMHLRIHMLPCLLSLSWTMQAYGQLRLLIRRGVLLYY